MCTFTQVGYTVRLYFVHPCFTLLLLSFFTYHLLFTHCISLKDWGLSQGIMLTISKYLKHATLICYDLYTSVHQCVSPAFML